MLRILSFIITFVFLIADYSFAVPLITSASGTVNKGASLNVRGTGFGTKQNQTPLKWDDFEQSIYSVGSQLSNGWQYRSQDVILYNNTGCRSGSTRHIRARHGDWGTGRFYYNGNSDLNEIYVTMWYRWSNSNAQPTGDNYKWLALWNDGASFSYPHLGITTQPVSSHWTYAYVRGYGESSYTNLATVPVIPYNQWVRVELYIKEGYSDGRVTLTTHTNGAIQNVIDRTTATNSLNAALHYRDVMFDEFNRVNSDVITVDHDLIYIDNTRARVEIGNRSTWNACTYREVQIPTAWSANSISVTVNQGAFSAGQQAYLYVIDPNGVASSGLPITIGGSTSTGDVSAPGQPLGLSVQILP